MSTVANSKSSYSPWVNIESAGWVNIQSARTHDSIFIPLVTTTLPNMGIKVVRTSFGCPKQNGVVERFNRTLTEELLDHLIPLGAQHISPGSVACTTVTAERPSKLI